MTLRLCTTGSYAGTNRQTPGGKPHDSSKDVPETSPNDIFERTWAQSIFQGLPHECRIRIIIADRFLR